MTRLYLKIFFGFWLVTALMIVGTNLVVHWFDLSSNKNLTQQKRDRHSDPAKQLLHKAVSASINYTQSQARQGLRDMPHWASRHIFIVDQQNNDLMRRPLPGPVVELLDNMSPQKPSCNDVIDGRHLFGRLITLADGTAVKVITMSRKGPHKDENIIWQMFLQNIWPLLLVSILVSGTACLYLAKRLARGFQTLQVATRQIARGDLSVRISPQFAGQGEEITSLAADFDNMTERLEKAMLEQKRLIKDVSHELRSPLARLQIALGLAQQRNQGTVDTELERIKEAADYLNDVISDILSMPVHDDANWQLDDTIELSSLLKTLVNNYSDDAELKNVQLNLNQPEGEFLVATHGNTMVGVFENILRNALHYTPPHSCVDITLYTTPSASGKNSAQSKPSFSCIEIRDRGNGVAESALEDIFQPFFRTSEARDRSSGGYGLGLAIAARTVALHCGQIKADNHPDGGLKVLVSLPYLSIE